MNTLSPQRPHLVVLSGAGMSAESGLSTFRDSDGLWAGHDVQEVASIEGWYRDPQCVLDFYNQRRREFVASVASSVISATSSYSSTSSVSAPASSRSCRSSHESV